MKQKILLVDDEPNVLRSFERSLSKRFDLQVAEGGPQGLKIIDESPPFSVVVSDMRMPEISGQELLCHLRNKHPETTRIMLTANTDQETATMAINDCRVFRFITKPCSSEALAEGIDDGIEEFRRFTSERDLLEKTLEGTIDLLNDVLKSVNPEALTKSIRLRGMANAMCKLLARDNGWEIESAAALSQIGCLAGHGADGSKSPSNVSDFDQAGIAAEMISHLPRMESVSDMIRFQSESNWEGQRDADSETIAGAKLLKLLLTYDTIVETETPAVAIETLSNNALFSNQSEWLGALTKAVTENLECLEVNIAGLNTSMIVDEDVFATNGVLLISQGCQESDRLRERLLEYQKSNRGVVEPIKVKRIG